MLFTLWASLSASTQQVGKAGGLQILCCQGFAVAEYSFTLDALTLKPSGFCNVRVYFAEVGLKPASAKLFLILRKSREVSLDKEMLKNVVASKFFYQ